MKKIFQLFFLLLVAAVTTTASAKTGKHPPQLVKPPQVNMKFIVSPTSNSLTVNEKGNVHATKQMTVTAKKYAPGGANFSPGITVTNNNTRIATVPKNEYLPPQRQGDIISVNNHNQAVPGGTMNTSTEISHTFTLPSTKPTLTTPTTNLLIPLLTITIT